MLVNFHLYFKTENKKKYFHNLKHFFPIYNFLLPELSQLFFVCYKLSDLFNSVCRTLHVFLIDYLQI
jgi:hypothetical protein